jgi:hypothetical protein
MRKYTFIDTPQKAIIIDNYCENFEELSNNFPHADVDGHEAKRFNLLSGNLKYDKGIWYPFIKKHLSREYFEETCLLIEDHLLEWRPKLLKKIKSGNYTWAIRDPKVDYDSVEYDISCDFKFAFGVNRMSTKQDGLPDIFKNEKFFTNKGIPPHVDSQNNIVQNMIYIPELEDNSSGGDMHLHKLRADGSLFDIVKCKYTHNRCLIFPHHPSGWHFVTPRESQFHRRAVAVIYTVKKSLQEIDPKFFAQFNKEL